MYVYTKRGPSRHTTLKQTSYRRYDVVLTLCACLDSFGVKYHVFYSAEMNTYSQHAEKASASAP